MLVSSAYGSVAPSTPLPSLPDLLSALAGPGASHVSVSALSAFLNAFGGVGTVSAPLAHGDDDIGIVTLGDVALSLSPSLKPLPAPPLPSIVLLRSVSSGGPASMGSGLSPFVKPSPSVIDAPTAPMASPHDGTDAAEVAARVLAAKSLRPDVLGHLCPVRPGPLKLDGGAVTPAA